MVKDDIVRISYRHLIMTLAYKWTFISLFKKKIYTITNASVDPIHVTHYLGK